MKTMAMLLSASLIGCVMPPTSTGAGTRSDSAAGHTDALGDAALVADTPRGVTDAAPSAPGCGESFIEVDYTLPSGERLQVCRTTLQGLGAHYDQCRRAFVEAEFLGDLDPVVATWRVRERGGFNRLGASTMHFVAASPLGRENCPSADQFCFKFGDCPVHVTSSGRVGDRVEAILTAPCELRHSDDPGRVVTVHRARVVGRMTLASTGYYSHGDAGLFGSGPRCEY